MWDTARPMKVHTISLAPAVLMLQLNRWVGMGIAAIILDPIEATLRISFKDDTYDLCSVVVHLCGSPMSGHYIALARHEHDNGV